MTSTDHLPGLPRPGAGVVASCLLAALCACTLGPDYQRPTIDTPSQYRTPDVSAVAAGAADTAWWQQFGDPALDALIAESLASNRDLMAAAARVEQFYGGLETTRSALFPQVGAELAGSRSRASEKSISPAPGSNPYTVYQANLLASWEIDLFGRIRRQSEAAQAELVASEEFRRATVMSVVSAVAGGYVRLRDLDRELEVARETVAAREKALGVFDRRFRGGVVSAVEVAQARSEYAAALKTVPTIEQAVIQQENALSVLAGRNPGPIERGKRIDELVMPLVPAGLPSQLLERRPDLRQAEQSLIAANARIGAARALYFPSISLTGALGAASRSLSDLWSGPARAWSYAGSLSAPLFTAGGIAGQVRSAEAAQREAVAQYQKAVQTAFRETEDALVGVDKSAQARDAQLEQVRALERYAHQARRRYEGGYTSYLEVLDAERSLFSAQLQLAQSQADALLQAVALYKALAGGWLDMADRAAPQPGVRVGQTPASSR